LRDAGQVDDGCPARVAAELRRRHVTPAAIQGFVDDAVTRLGASGGL
jgi:hypothetical protein